MENEIKELLAREMRKAQLGGSSPDRAIEVARQTVATQLDRIVSRWANQQQADYVTFLGV